MSSQDFENFEKGLGPDELYMLGRMYFEADDVDEDNDKAIRYLTSAANDGQPMAQNFLGYCYKNGYVVERDPKKAFELYELSAKQGYSEAQHNLGICYEDGIGVQSDMKTAFDWYMEAAKQGQHSSQNNVGLQYLNGGIVEKDITNAIAWFVKAEKNGNTIATNNLNNIALAGYSDDILNIKRMVYEGKILYEEGAKYFQRGDIDTGLNMLIDAAKSGHPDAQCKLADMLSDEGNKTAAFEWYLESAQRGFDIARYHVGLCYAFGRGTEKDPQQAVYWMRKAVLERTDMWENDEALYSMGFFNYAGLGMEKNVYAAAFWFTKAAVLDHPHAQYSLGMCYLRGDGVEENENTARRWLEAAAQNGIDEAAETLRKLDEK